ncbi:MAG: RsmF rRNA methyltransferase first C-terminal domain-containing protein [Anaerolineae bacterium]|nr:RsmF rRNA methyltransferase first C-terminal domain-containing protein [Anaerolineae bacterium]
MRPPIPPDFLARMHTLLGDDYPAFAQSYDAPGVVGLRVNTLKIAPVDFNRIAPFTLMPAGEWDAAAFHLIPSITNTPITNTPLPPGKHPYHWAGLYYLQEPSAMVVGALMRPQPGEWVLDLSAAPGGKSTHLAALMGDKGLLVSNEIDRGRAHILADNLARWGTYNSLITNDTPEKLAQTWGAIFDRVLVDAPCSGEGMFRRQGGFAWSESIIQACARRQKGILAAAADLVRPGGRLVYATCTFAPEEDEQVIAHFLAQRPEFSLIAHPHWAGLSPGHPDWADGQPELSQTVRLWPHRFMGEGHFVAVMEREAPGREPSVVNQPKRRPFKTNNFIPNEWRGFAGQTLAVDFPAEQFHFAGNKLYLLPEQAIDTGKLRLVRYGLLLGELNKGVFKPAHPLALALSKGEVNAVLDFPAAAGQITAYLAGHDFPADGPDGWVLVTVDGYGLGWGKRVRGRVKNHYPHPWRQR